MMREEEEENPMVIEENTISKLEADTPLTLQ